MADRKGWVGGGVLDDEVLEDWEAFSLPLDDTYMRSLRPLTAVSTRPGMFFRGTFRIATMGDTYIDMSAWDKGYAWINGHLLGRYWHIGPQQRLYCPASWLKDGDNEVTVFDMHRVDAAMVRGVRSLAD